MIVYWLYRIGVLLANLLPEGILYSLADSLGIGAYYILRGKRKVLESNLGVVFLNDKALLNGIVRRIFCNYARYHTTLFRFPFLKDEDINRLIELKGLENLEKALQGGRGAILVTAHLGHWDLGGAALARHFKINVVVEHLPSEKLFRLFTRFRVHQGMKVITKSNLRRLFEALLRNEVVVLLADRDMDRKGIVIPFFGKMTTMPIGPARLAYKTGAPILPAFVIKERGKEHYYGIIEREINISKGNDKGKEIELNTIRITRAIEDHIKMYPENWYMFQPIWR